jgi:hypothetical protein
MCVCTPRLTRSILVASEPMDDAKRQLDKRSPGFAFDLVARPESTD